MDGKEEIKLLLFAGNMIVYSENSEDPTDADFELLSEIGKVTVYKVNGK